MGGHVGVALLSLCGLLFCDNVQWGVGWTRNTSQITTTRQLGFSTMPPVQSSGQTMLRNRRSTTTAHASEFSVADVSSGVGLDSSISKSTIVPVHDNIIVQPKQSQKFTAGGLLLTPEFCNIERTGRVLAVGGGRVDRRSGVHIPVDVTVGDWVVFEDNSDNKIKYDGKDCIILQACHVVAKVMDPEGLATPDNMIPHVDKILVRLQQSTSTTSSGLIIKTTKDEAPDTGRVVATGMGAFDSNGTRIDIQIKNGDNVKFSRYADSRVCLKFGNNEYAFVEYDDILAKWADN